MVTLYNWARPRDLSHYETFEHYHATLYQQVEALSVTPFSPRALDRGLTALLVSFIRLYGEPFNANETAQELTLQHPYVQQAIQQISQRAIELGGRAEQTATEMAGQVRRRHQRPRHRARHRRPPPRRRCHAHRPPPARTARPLRPRPASRCIVR